MTFTVTLIAPGACLVVCDQTGDTIGIFGSKEAIEAACAKYRDTYDEAATATRH